MGMVHGMGAATIGVALLLGSLPSAAVGPISSGKIGHRRIERTIRYPDKWRAFCDQDACAVIELVKCTGDDTERHRRRRRDADSSGRLLSGARIYRQGTRAERVLTRSARSVSPSGAMVATRTSHISRQHDVALAKAWPQSPRAALCRHYGSVVA